MREISKAIRAYLKSQGITNRMVSVKCKSDYTIHVKAKCGLIGHEWLIKVVADEYYKKPHSWLIVYVNGVSLPMDRRAGI